MNLTTFEQFVEWAQRGTFVPVCKEIMADLLTPVSAFLKIAEHSDYAYLLESVEGGEQVARYSFLGKDPFLIVRAVDGAVTLERGGTTTTSDEGYVPTLRRVMAEFRSPYIPGMPRFTGGAVGFMGYDAVSWFEPVTLQPPAESDPVVDQAGFMLFDTVLAFDHVQHRILIIANARISADDDLKALYQFACAKIEFLERELERSLSLGERQAAPPIDVHANMTQEQFEQHVRSAKELIASGDIYQVVLSQRFETDLAADPFAVYRALRHVNPSPYMFFVRMSGVAMVGASPEMLVRVEGRRVETHPIAGTRPRGRNPEEDQRLAEELKASEKERAEHVMLVDLGRNDLGKVCDYGSVRVPQFMALERYSHVMHLVSIVEGKLSEDRDRLDALVSCFPAGTVSGAPKVRAMEIIASLEPTRRGAYGGAVGYLDFAGNLDFCITIRTIVIVGRRAMVQAGAGIVADSNPTAEYEETRDKARAMVRALDLAQQGL
ncbi:MAG: anthranilate synthase component I [Acidobacteriota bacterium]